VIEVSRHSIQRQVREWHSAYILVAGHGEITFKDLAGLSDRASRGLDRI
jgi:hypothetical protein